MELLQQLTQQLGINQQQASGGVGLLMGLAKNKLGSDFNKVSQHAPEVEEMIRSAPNAQAANVSGSQGGVGALGGLLGGGSGSLGGIVGGSGTLGSLANLAGGFQQLGLSPSMIGRFLPIVLGFFQRKGGDQTKGLLEQALA